MIISEYVRPVAELGAGALELLGIGVIGLASIYGLLAAGWHVLQRRDTDSVFRECRHRLARGILLGLELLVGADIVHTVAIDLSFSSVGVLAIVVLIRTFLSFSLEVELTGRWPWRAPQAPPEGQRAG